MALVRAFLCLLISVFLYLACLLVGCVPCLHFYFCRRASFTHRHKCAKTFVRRSTLLFHYSVFTFSLLSSMALILLNVLLLTSVHLFGPNNWPPEISRFCISVDQQHRLIRPLFLPQQTLFFSSAPTSVQREENAFLPPIQQCKPLWDFPHHLSTTTFAASTAAAAFNTIPLLPAFEEWMPGMERMRPGPWQARVPLADGTVLAVSTHFVSDHRQSTAPNHTLFYDFALLKFGTDNSTRTAQCIRRQFTQWLFINRLNPLGFPYFLACSPTIRIRKAALIDCEALIHGKRTSAK